eukprot:gene15789-4765_t
MGKKEDPSTDSETHLLFGPKKEPTGSFASQNSRWTLFLDRKLLHTLTIQILLTLYTLTSIPWPYTLTSLHALTDLHTLTPFTLLIHTLTSTLPPPYTDLHTTTSIHWPSTIPPPRPPHYPLHTLALHTQIPSPHRPTPLRHT